MTALKVPPIQAIEDAIKFGEKMSNTPLLDICKEVYKEVSRATEMHGPMGSAHEGYAVMLEEMDELWDHVKMKQQLRDHRAMRKEAIQLAAMAVRFVYDITDQDNRK